MKFEHLKKQIKLDIKQAKNNVKRYLTTFKTASQGWLPLKEPEILKMGKK